MPSNGRKELCGYRGCGRVATRQHERSPGNPACGHHWRADVVMFAVPAKGVVEDIGSVIRTDTDHRVTPRWSNLRTSDGPQAVTIVDPVNWCADCGEPIRKAFSYCKACSAGREATGDDIVKLPEGALVVVTSGKLNKERVMFHLPKAYGNRFGTRCVGVGFGSYSRAQLVTAGEAQAQGLVLCHLCQRRMVAGYGDDELAKETVKE